jgi:DNA-binding LacI/PurR family transcriptional regulator
MATSINDIARAAGVSCTTVLRALWDRDRIAPGTKARVLKVAAELNYRPNMVARSLVSGKTKLIGLLVGADAHSFNRYIERIHHRIRQAGYGVLVYMAVEGPEGELACAHEMICNRVTGVLGQPTQRSRDSEPYQQLIEAKIPVVTYDRSLDGLDAPQVITDQYKLGRVAAEHLLSLGHKRIAHLAIPGVGFLATERARGIADAMRDAGLSLRQSDVVETGWLMEDGAAAMCQLLRSNGDWPTAVIARHDLAAIGAIEAIQQAGLSVPGDVSVMGVADIPLTARLAVPLTTIGLPSDHIADVAVERLLDIIEGRFVEPKVHALADFSLITRASTAPPKPHA